MKKLILTSLLTLALAASASAAVPAGGVYLDKDGTPLTEAQQVPPSLRSHKMAPQNAAIQEAMAALPHSTSTLIALTVTEDGTAANASVVQSSGSIILDQYAIDSVNLWQFHPAKRGDRSVSTSVTIPLRFISTMISVLRLMMSPKTDTSAGSPVTPMTPASCPSSTMGRLMPRWTPASGSSSQMVSSGSPSRMIRRAP